MTITLRSTKGSALTHNELDGNFTHLQMPIVALTDAAVTMEANKHYIGSIASWAASRNYELPAASAGDLIRVTLTEGDDTYALILLGDDGITINNGSAATEWSRLFISGETALLMATSSTNWQVIQNGKKGSQGHAYLAANAGTAVNAQYTQVPLDTTLVDTGGIVDLANDRMNVRRAGNYDIFAGAGTRDNVAATLTGLYLQTDGGILIGDKMEALNSTKSAIGTAISVPLTIGTISIQLYHDNGADRAFRGLQNTTFFKLVERL